MNIGGSHKIRIYINWYLRVSNLLMTRTIKVSIGHGAENSTKHKLGSCVEDLRDYVVLFKYKYMTIMCGCLPFRWVNFIQYISYLSMIS